MIISRQKAQQRYREKYPERVKKSHRDWNRRIRRAVLAILGDECIRCGFNDWRVLQIDHINGGGSKEFKEIGAASTFHLKVIESVKNNENKYQLLCANCNWIKKYEKGEVR